MTIAATGARGEALEKLAELIANSDTAQDRAGGNPTAAQMHARIFWPHLSDPYAAADQVGYPLFVITPGAASARRDSGGSFNRSGALRLKVIDVARVEIATQEDLKDAQMDFLNFVDGLCAEMESLSLTDDHLSLQAWQDTIAVSMSDPRKESDRDSQRPYFFLELEVTWDPTGGGE